MLVGALTGQTPERFLEDGDDELETRPAGVDESSNGEWNAAVEPAWLHYRVAAAFADTVPTTLALVTDDRRRRTGPVAIR